MVKTKQQLRCHFQALRQGLSVAQRHTAKQQLLLHWHNESLAQEATHIGSYLSTQNEFPTDGLHPLLWQQKKHVYVPKLNPLAFSELWPDSRLSKTALAIFEPESYSPIDIGALDIALIPLLAIDAQGYRLGYGKGYYDRLLAKKSKLPVLIGLGFSQQFTDELPHDPWDIPLDGFLSEDGWLFFAT